MINETLKLKLDDSQFVKRLREVASAIKKTNAAIKATKEEIKETILENEELQKGVKKFLPGLAKLNWGFVGVAGAIGGTATAMVKLATDAADSADSIIKLSEVTGITAQELSRFQQIADKSPLSGGIDKLAEGLQRLNSEDGAKILQDLGVSGADASEKLMNLSEWYTQTGNTAERSARITKLFGDGLARDLSPTLALGAESMRQLMEENDRFNRTLTAESIANVGLYKDAHQELQGSIQGLGNQLMILLPVITDVFKAMGGGVRVLGDLVNGTKAAAEGAALVGETIKNWIFSYDNWEEAADKVALAVAADAQASEEGAKAAAELTKQKNLEAQAAAEAKRQLDANRKAAAEASKAAAAYTKMLWAQQDAQLALNAQLAEYGELMEASLPPLEKVTSGLSEASDGAWALLPPLEGLDGALGDVDGSGLKAANTLGKIRDAAKQTWDVVKDLTKAALDLGLAFASGALTVGISTLQFDIAGILQQFAKAIPDAISRLRQFSSQAFKLLQQAFGELPEWIGKAGAAAGAALAVIGGAAGAALGLVSAAVSAVDKLIQQFAGVSISGILFGDPADVKIIIAEALQGLGDFIANAPSILEQLFESGALLSFFQEALDGLVELLPTALPQVVSFLTQAATALIQSLPAILKALIASDLGQLIKDVLLTLADQLPVLIPMLIELGAQIMVGIVEALPALIEGIIRALPDIAVGLIKALGALFLGLIAGILDALGLDKAADRVSGAIDAAYADTPGLLRAGPSGATIKINPGDYYGAAQSRDKAESGFSDRRLVGEMERSRMGQGRMIRLLEELVESNRTPGYVGVPMGRY